ncbi:MAG TPA: HNH endonuclease [Pseudorhizobium sp.]|jgi:5-methylcytosine-specific restriction endonuclease McrA|nr:HNH endonuclease [Pseudorhizobium sp.]
MCDVGTTKRKAMSPSRRLRIWEAHGGICCLCQTKIDGVREEWTVEHLRALGLGGEDDDKNCAPAHERCRRQKDKVDAKAIAKAKRVKSRHLGLKPKSSLSNQRFKKLMDGTVVDRRTGEIIAGR